MGNLSKPQDLAAIRARIARLSPDSQRLWGKMTVGQMLPHVTDQLRMAMGELPVAKAGNVLTRTLVKWMVLAGAPAPKGKVETLPELNQSKNAGTPPTDFETDRRILLEKLEEFCGKGPDYQWTPHGAFGRMNGSQWRNMAYSHLDHHLRQFGV